MRTKRVQHTCLSDCLSGVPSPERHFNSMNAIDACLFGLILVFIKFLLVLFFVLILNVSSRCRCRRKLAKATEKRTRQARRRRRSARTPFEWRMDNLMVHCIRSFVAQCRCDQPKRSTLQIILCVNIERTEITLIRRHRWRLQYIISYHFECVCACA